MHYSVNIEGTATGCDQIVVTINSSQEQKKQVPVTFGIGLVLIAYSTSAMCCNNNLLIGIGLIGLSIPLMIAWANGCQKTFCVIIQEMAFIVATYVLVAIAFIQSNLTLVLGSCYNPTNYNYLIYFNALLVIILVLFLATRRN